MRRLEDWDALMQQLPPGSEVLLLARHALDNCPHWDTYSEFPHVRHRSIFAIIAQNEENRILSVIRRGVATQGFAVESLQFDGLFCIVRSDKALDLAPIEREILETTGYAVKIVGKELYFSGASSGGRWHEGVVLGHAASNGASK